jgi:hypothetical protein
VRREASKLIRIASPEKVERETEGQAKTHLHQPLPPLPKSRIVQRLRRHVVRRADLLISADVSRVTGDGFRNTKVDEFEATLNEDEVGGFEVGVDDGFVVDDLNGGEHLSVEEKFSMEDGKKRREMGRRRTCSQMYRMKLRLIGLPEYPARRPARSVSPASITCEESGCRRQKRRKGEKGEETHHDDILPLHLRVDELNDLRFPAKLPKEGDLVDEARSGLGVVLRVDLLEGVELVSLRHDTVDARGSALPEDAGAVVDLAVDL